MQQALADRLVFSAIKARMGGKIRFFMSGSAGLNREVQEWFYAAGLLLLEGYGLTETSSLTSVNNPRAPRFGTVGPAILGCLQGALEIVGDSSDVMEWIEFDQMLQRRRQQRFILHDQYLEHLNPLL